MSLKLSIRKSLDKQMRDRVVRQEREVAERLRSIEKGLGF